MTDLKKLEARLMNTEKALFVLATILHDVQAPIIQEQIDAVMLDYFDANVSLGFISKANFKTVTDLKDS